jgi:hypothetical protein
MSVLSRIFGEKPSATDNTSVARTTTPEFDRLLAFGGALKRLLDEDKYLARSDYKPLTEEYADTQQFFENLQKSYLLSMYCAENGLDENRIKKAFMKTA